MKPLNICKQHKKHADEDAMRNVVTEKNLKGFFLKKATRGKTEA